MELLSRRDVDLTSRDEVKKIVKSSIGTKFIKKWFVFLPHCAFLFSSFLLCFTSCRSDLACDMALNAVETVAMESGDRKEIDIKRYAKVEKVVPQ